MTREQVEPESRLVRNASTRRASERIRITRKHTRANTSRTDTRAYSVHAGTNETCTITDTHLDTQLHEYTSIRQGKTYEPVAAAVSNVEMTRQQFTMHSSLSPGDAKSLISQSADCSQTYEHTKRRGVTPWMRSVLSCTEVLALTAQSCRLHSRACRHLQAGCGAHVACATRLRLRQAFSRALASHTQQNPAR